ncbi:hypothetical protein DEG02_017175 [Xanthomonas vasicola]|uniref:Helix-turn-helix domain-containing protein n=1 Tax=Xanthomonas vasicola TaxID=56459 RepID=A0ABD7S8Q6_XANVA|nr:hypothetical protein NX81_006650 [Xanthomonas vasicola]AZR31797.1 hypothetical protein KWO_015965 [Xanthomonas vasicola pv. musacearum NCPPB 4379]KFA10746.1 hypothetical protein KWM_0108205 [Xanthomonas vasicola pv. musacearum NCPPB 2005]KFA10838.1 hypothetical protein KWQ_0110110 [Xanthomonas vasicola pv. musacearum NCPPB 4380]KFA17089.1 hypothetical protein KWU_0122055 [Xanthomonas vasicola pv. musacearum NCPPB 4394]KFA18048.1 hypothetical protein A11G_0112620 [Xanthomonas vasicola pv. mu
MYVDKIGIQKASRILDQFTKAQTWFESLDLSEQLQHFVNSCGISHSCLTQVLDGACRVHEPSPSRALLHARLDPSVMGWIHAQSPAS